MPAFIIIVDNKPFLPDTLEMIISKYFPDQFTIVAFNNTTSAFNVIEELTIKKETIALIICNSQMPNLTGYEFLNLINTISPSSTKVLSTSYIKLTEYQEFLTGNLIDFILEKPFNTNSLINIIQSTIKQQNALNINQKNNDIIQSLKNSLATLRSIYHLRKKTLITLSSSLNAFYFSINLKNSFFDIYTDSETIFGYKVTSINDFDSFLTIVVPDDQAKLIESIKKIKVMMNKQDVIHFKIIDINKKIISIKCVLVAEEIDNITGAESIIGFMQNITTELGD